MNRKRLMVDVAGYTSLIPMFMLHNYLERSHDGFVAVLVPFIAYLPIAALWHHYYVKFSEHG